MLEIKNFLASEHWGIVESWFTKRNFPVPNKRYLPKHGVIVFKAGLPVCSGFLFQSDAGAATIGHLSSNPDASGPDRNECLDAMIGCLTEDAVGLGFELVCCATNIPRLMERFAKLGFTKTDENVANFGRILVCQ